MHSRRRLACLFVLVSAAPLRAQDTARVPTSAEVIARYLRAADPDGVYARIRSMHTRGTVEIPAAGISGEVEGYSARPAKMWSRTSLGAAGEIVSGFDGETGWIMNPATGPALLDSLQLRRLRYVSAYDNFPHPASAFRSISAPVVEMFEGVRCYRLHLVTTTGFELDELFDVATGLRRGVRFEQQSLAGSVPVVNVFDDYRSFGGLMVPTRVTQRTPSLTVVQTTTSVEFDAAPDSVFALPPAVRALK